MAQVLKGFNWPLDDKEAFRFLKEAVESYYGRTMRVPNVMTITPNEFTGVVTVKTKEGDVFDIQIKRREKSKFITSQTSKLETGK